MAMMTEAEQRAWLARLDALQAERAVAAAEAAAEAAARKAANDASIARRQAEHDAADATARFALAERHELRLKARALAAWQRGGGATANFETAWPGLRADAEKAMLLAELTTPTPQRHVTL